MCLEIKSFLQHATFSCLGKYFLVEKGPDLIFNTISVVKGITKR